ncbi:haloacid dehalogenase, type II [Aspergillus sclerotiicarbonarius CBS 121057]|uniref:Haloacid dehalogenase, type II n=1 Tax=Aspergillus sclerotiicarbonarius (strain CBS 121057 / IBT 28362) TaxID=1448318 RepID=A0A319E469_ASPSB|nr:haloacid dehalogenase, type II [Aspergillus sclerotiicarbonarius CBS 121057]
MTGNIVLAFDIYGTLLSFEAVIHEPERCLENDQARARTVSQTWRRYQLEYTWRLNSMGRYLSFLEVTKNALLHALDDTGSSLGSNEIEHLMATYNSLSPFPDVEDALSRLAASVQTTPVIFSNGTLDMVSNCIDRSTLSRHKAFFKDTVSVDEVGQYKPAPAVYKHLAERVGKDESGLKEIWLVSGNPVDVAGALNVGMNAIWVDRAQAGWVDKALPELQPTATIHHLEGIVDVLQDHL